MPSSVWFGQAYRAALRSFRPLDCFHHLPSCNNSFEYSKSLPPTSLTVLILTPKNYPWDLWRTTLTLCVIFSMYTQICFAEKSPTVPIGQNRSTTGRQSGLSYLHQRPQQEDHLDHANWVYIVFLHHYMYCNVWLCRRNVACLQHTLSSVAMNGQY